MRAAVDETDTAEGYLDWKRQARETVWLLATDGRDEVGAAIGIGGWHSPEGVARGEVRVVAARARSRGRLRPARRALRLGARAPVRRADGTGQGGRRGVPRLDGEARASPRSGRNSILALDLRTIDAPAVIVPDGIEIVTWAERPDAAAGMYEVAREAYPDIPGEEDAEIEPVRAVALDGHAGRRRPARGHVRRARGRRGRRVRQARALARPSHRRDARHHRREARLARPRDRGCAQGGGDRVGEGERDTSASRRRTRSETSRSGASTSATGTSSSRARSRSAGRSSTERTGRSAGGSAIASRQVRESTRETSETCEDGERRVAERQVAFGADRHARSSLTSCATGESETLRPDRPSVATSNATAEPDVTEASAKWTRRPTSGYRDGMILHRTSAVRAACVKVTLRRIRSSAGLDPSKLLNSALRATSGARARPARRRCARRVGVQGSDRATQ